MRWLNASPEWLPAACYPALPYNCAHIVTVSETPAKKRCLFTHRRAREGERRQLNGALRGGVGNPEERKREGTRRETYLQMSLSTPAEGSDWISVSQGFREAATGGKWGAAGREVWGLPKVPYCLLRPVIYAHGNVWRQSCRGSRSEGAKVEEEEEESRGGRVGGLWGAVGGGEDVFGATDRREEGKPRVIGEKMEWGKSMAKDHWSLRPRDV